MTITVAILKYLLKSGEPSPYSENHLLESEKIIDPMLGRVLAVNFDMKKIASSKLNAHLAKEYDETFGATASCHNAFCACFGDEKSAFEREGSRFDGVNTCRFGPQTVQYLKIKMKKRASPKFEGQIQDI